MNLKIQTDGLQGAGAVQNAPAPSGHRHGSGRTGQTQDSVGISDLSSRIAESLSDADVRMEGRIAELAKLHAQGRYAPDAAALSRSMVSRALDSDQGLKL